jgi:hypothetical protein
MSTAERATAMVQPLPKRERPLSEQYRLVAKAWVQAEHAASLLEDTKSAVLAQMMVAKGDLPVSKAEMLTKASQEWREHLEVIANARREANLRKVQMAYVEMKFKEWMASDANQRSERRLSR